MCTGNIPAHCASPAPAPPSLVLLLQKSGILFCWLHLRGWVPSSCSAIPLRGMSTQENKGSRSTLCTCICLPLSGCVVLCSLSSDTSPFVSLALSPGCLFVYQLLMNCSTSIYWVCSAAALAVCLSQPSDRDTAPYQTCWLVPATHQCTVLGYLPTVLSACISWCCQILLLCFCVFMLFSIIEILLCMKSIELPCKCTSNLGFRERRIHIKLGSMSAPFVLFPWSSDGSSDVAPAGRTVWGLLVCLSYFGFKWEKIDVAQIEYYEWSRYFSSNRTSFLFFQNKNIFCFGLIVNPAFPDPYTCCLLSDQCPCYSAGTLYQWLEPSAAQIQVGMGCSHTGGGSQPAHTPTSSQLRSSH